LKFHKGLELPKQKYYNAGGIRFFCCIFRVPIFIIMNNIYLLTTVLLVSLSQCLSQSYASLLSDTIKSIPFTENWDSQTFDTNNWSFPNSQGNWTILINEGDSAPCAAFTGLPSKSNYTYTLQSPWFDATGLICDSIYISFDLKLVGTNNTGNEKLSIFLEYDTVNNSVFLSKNIRNLPWKNYQILLPKVHGRIFRVQIVAYGEFSTNLSSWMIDNFSISKKCRRPNDFYAWGEPEQNQCRVVMTWSPPDCTNPDLIEFIFDNGCPDTQYGGVSDEIWLGNYFPINQYSVYSGTILDFKLYITSIMSDTLKIDVFDENRVLLGSSQKFSCQNTYWDTIPVSPIQFTGPFYVMLKFIHGDGTFLAVDKGQFYKQNLSWIKDHDTWQLTSTYVGHYADSIICLMRVTAEISGKKIVLTTGDSTILLGYNVFKKDQGQSNFTKINQTLVTDTTFYDWLTSWISTYAVTAVYENCEYDLSNYHSIHMEGDCYSSLSDNNKTPFSLYPNPASDYVGVKCGVSIEQIKLYDMFGILMKEKQNIHEDFTEIPVDNLTTGIYFIVLTTRDGTGVKKLIISR